MKHITLYESFLNEAEGPLVGFNGETIKIGDTVEVQFVTGSYGQTKQLQGILVEVPARRQDNQNSDVKIKLILKEPWTQYGRYSETYKDGDIKTLTAAFGKGGYVHRDYEHGHTTYIKKV